MPVIKEIQAREILDSRGFPTVEAEVILDSGIRARSCVPSGASTGIREALELRDKDPKRFMGKGVLNACDNIRERIFPAIKNHEVAHQREIDEILITLDGSPNKEKLGANAMLAVSLCCARAAALSQNMPLYRYLAAQSSNICSMPIPMLNILNGGAHA